jgi:acetate kinase
MSITGSAQPKAKRKNKRKGTNIIDVFFFNSYDPALHRLLHMLMRKVFWQLLHELKMLGARVVHATFNQIIIVTNKTSLEDARLYWDFVHKVLPFLVVCCFVNIF